MILGPHEYVDYVNTIENIMHKTNTRSHTLS